MITKPCIETNPSICLRLHLVRHGETEANEKGIVLGQIDSPLSTGVDQSYAARRAFGRYPFWRRISSDLFRAQRTARIILGIEKQIGKNQDSETDDTDSEDKEDGLILDARLRERAKGVREGQDRNLTYDEAWNNFVESRRKEGLTDTRKWTIPKHENEEDVWERIKDFLQENLLDAYLEFTSNDEYSIFTRKPINVDLDLLAVSHSGTIRTLINKLVEDQLPMDVEREDQSMDGQCKGRLKIPNTSKTIIEFRPCSNQNSLLSVMVPDGKYMYWQPKLIDFANVKHLNHLK